MLFINANSYTTEKVGQYGTETAGLKMGPTPALIAAKSILPLSPAYLIVIVYVK